jgi:hypothetical protein
MFQKDGSLQTNLKQQPIKLHKYQLTLLFATSLKSFTVAKKTLCFFYVTKEGVDWIHGVSDETVKYGREFCGTLTQE